MSAAPAALAQGRIVSATGTVSLTRAGRELGRPAAGADLQAGDEIATGENSEALVRAEDGSTVRVYPDSRVVIQEYAPGLREWLHLFLGSVKVHIQRISGRPNPQGMTTPTAVIAVRGTVFEVFVDEMDATMVQVEQGMVSVAARASPRDEVLLRPGQRTWVGRGAPPLPPQAVAARARRPEAPPPHAKAWGRRERAFDVPPGRALGAKTPHPGTVR